MDGRWSGGGGFIDEINRFRTHPKPLSLRRDARGASAFAIDESRLRARTYEVPTGADESLKQAEIISSIIIKNFHRWKKELHHIVLQASQIHLREKVKENQSVLANQSSTGITSTVKFSHDNVMNVSETRHDNAGRLGLQRQITHICFTATNMAYGPALDNWIVMVSQNVSMIGVIIATDEPTCTYAHERGHPVLCFQSEGLSTIWESITDQAKMGMGVVGIAKVLGPFVALEFNLNVVFSEMDVWWQHDPLPELTKEENAKYDVQISSTVWHNNHNAHMNTGELNIGFFYARSTDETIRIFINMAQHIILNPIPLFTTATYDQKIVDRYVRTPYATLPSDTGNLPQTWDWYFPDQDVADHVAHKWRRLPVTYTLNGYVACVCFQNI